MKHRVSTDNMNNESTEKGRKHTLREILTLQD